MYLSPLGRGTRDCRPGRLVGVVQSSAAAAAAWPLGAFGTARGTPVISRAAAAGRLPLFARARAPVVAAPAALAALRHGSGKLVGRSERARLGAERCWRRIGHQKKKSPPRSAPFDRLRTMMRFPMLAALAALFTVVSADMYDVLEPTKPVHPEFNR